MRRAIKGVRACVAAEAYGRTIVVIRRYYGSECLPGRGKERVRERFEFGNSAILLLLGLTDTMVVAPERSDQL